MPLQIHTAPPQLGDPILGKTLVEMLDEVVEKYPNPTAFNQPRDGGGWTTMSNNDFRDAADEVALGLLEAGLERGDHAAFFMDSDMYFALADFSCLIAGIVNAPLYTTYAEDNLVYVTEHAEAKAMFVSNPTMLAQLAKWLPRVPSVKTVILAEGNAGSIAMPDGVRLFTLDELRALGRDRKKENPGELAELRSKVGAHDLTTLIYTSGTTGLPKGVMLTHENVSSNVLGALQALGALKHQEEVVVTFLPATHIFARMLTIAHIAYGHSIYFSNPDLLVGHLAELKPTFFATVPRVLEKVYDKVLLGVRDSDGVKKKIGTWALDLAGDYDLSKPKGGLSPIKFALADKLVYSKLREKLGLTRVKTVAVGGAALRADLAASFNAFGVPVVQGYGLTETSPVITMNRLDANRAGAVGQPIPGVEVAIAEDGEILSRGPHIMKGYYKADDKTEEVMDADNWFHTGDIGEFTPEGFLKITDRKKALFKLSTGKYVIPSPLENALMEDPLIEQAVVVGSGHKFCSALIFPSTEVLRGWAEDKGVGSMSDDALLKHPDVLAKYESLVKEANQGADHWSQIKRFKLISDLMTVENELLTPTMKVKRSAVSKAYNDDIERMYKADVADKHESVAVA
ncbi:MAG: long-chain fatty acid--CoA ligase [Rhodothermales bacterium]